MTDRVTILLVEDNNHLLNINAAALTLKGYRALKAKTIAQARTLLEKEDPQLIVLDILLPDGNGIDFCRELRKTSETPILFLTALGQDADIVRGLSAGGDDYLPKPHVLDVFVARIEALLRRSKGFQHEDIIEIEDLQLDCMARRAYLGGKDLLLKAKEFSLLELFVQHQGQFFSREELFNLFWSAEPNGDLRTVKSHISRVRAKLGKDSPITIENKRGIGYRVVLKPEC